MLSKYPIKQFAKVGAGQGAPQKETDFSLDGYPFIRAGHLESLLDGKDEFDLPKINFEIAKRYRLKLFQPNTIVFAKSGMSAMKGRIYRLKNPCYVVNHLATLELKENAFPAFVVYTLRSFSPVKLINDSSYPSLKQSTIESYEIPFPKNISVQIQIANILSKAEILITQRKQSIALLDEFLRSTFLEMFGDPGFNKKKWNKLTLKDVSLRFSDGPFGSNLKTEHYSNSGIQVIRLQNIGVNRFVEKDVSYVSEPHFESVLKKYSCFPNDVVIATMGSPNVRACIVPKHVKVAINKADCVLFRVNPKLSNHYYISHLLNQEGFLSLATSFIHGQTRARISSGQLAKILIPIPPLELQTQFSQIVEKTELLKTYYQSSLQELENLHGSLSQRAFKGELNLNKAAEHVLMAAESELQYNKL